MFGNKNKTPVTDAGLRMYDHLPAEEAAVRAWTVAGRSPELHRKQQQEVRDRMPLLARALDRLVNERRK